VKELPYLRAKGPKDPKAYGGRKYLYFEKDGFRARIYGTPGTPEFTATYERLMAETQSEDSKPTLSNTDGQIALSELTDHFAQRERAIARRARKFGREYSLPKYWCVDQYVLQDGRCALSGIVMRKPKRQNDPFGPSVDRICSDGGYTPDNCQLVALAVNQAKNNMSESEFLEMCRAVVAHLGPVHETRQHAETPEIVEGVSLYTPGQRRNAP